MATSTVRNLLSAKFKYLNRGKIKTMFKSGFASGSSERELDINSESNEGAKKPALNSVEKCLHEPVMVDEVIRYMAPKDGKVYIDMTFGAGGHTKSLLDTANNITVYALDRDPTAIERATEMAKHYAEIDALLTERDVARESVDGILFDVGFSSTQMDDHRRGFSLSVDGPLDMRMDGNRFPNLPAAYDVVNHTDERNLARILKTYGEESLAKPIARAIVEARYTLESIVTTDELARIVAAVSSRERTDKLGRRAHAATKTFQALRIFVNNELNELNYGIEAAHRYLRPVTGRLVAITFHSLEDRIVKRHINGIDMDEAISSTLSQKYKNASAWHTKDDVLRVYSNNWTPINRSVLNARPEEVARNPRSRSAKLRAATKNG